MRIFRFALVISLLLPAVASAQDAGRFRIQGLWANPTGDLKEDDVTIEADDAYGIRFAWEFLWSERFGLELGAATSDHDLLATSEGIEMNVADTRMTPITATINLHFAPGAQADFYVGVGAAYVLYDDVTVKVPDEPAEKFSVDDELTWMVQVGLDVPVGDRFGLTFAVQYIDTELDAGSADDHTVVPIEPWVAAAGLLIHF